MHEYLGSPAAERTTAERIGSVEELATDRLKEALIIMNNDLDAAEMARDMAVDAEDIEETDESVARILGIKWVIEITTELIARCKRHNYK
jgi:hypothetical protein